MVEFNHHIRFKVAAKPYQPHVVRVALSDRLLTVVLVNLYTAYRLRRSELLRFDQGILALKLEKGLPYNCMHTLIPIYFGEIKTQRAQNSKGDRGLGSDSGKEGKRERRRAGQTGRARTAKITTF